MSACIISAFAGALLAAVFSLMPGMHMAFIIAILLPVLDVIGVGEVYQIIAFIGGVTVGNLFFGIIPAIALSAPDDSTMLISRYGSRMMMTGKGPEAIALAALGTMIGLLLVCLLILPFLGNTGFHFEAFHLRSRWIICSVLAVLVLILIAGDADSQGAHSRYSGMAAGILTVILSGVIGYCAFVIRNAESGHPGTITLPLISGLFAAPSLLFNCVFRCHRAHLRFGADGSARGFALPLRNRQMVGRGVPAEPQRENVVLSRRAPNRRCARCHNPFQKSALSDVGRRLIINSSLSGALGGLLALAVPFGSAGVGSVCAYNFLRKDRYVAMISQGVARALYYSMLVLMLLVAGFPLPALSSSAMICAILRARGEPLFFAGACLLLPAVLAMAMLYLLLLKACRDAGAVNIRPVSAICLIGLVLIVFLYAGSSGIAVFITATAVGMVPSLYGVSRIYCLAGLMCPLIYL